MSSFLLIIALLGLLAGIVLMLGAPEAHGPLYLAVGLVLLLIWSCIPAKAQHAGHPPQDMELHKRFYSTWQMPDNRGVSCCHDEDCFPSQSKFEGGFWYARKSDDEDWIKIPPNKIEQDRDSPDGRSHLCGRKYAAGWSSGFTVFCFLPAGGS